MFTIEANKVDEALRKGLSILTEFGVRHNSRVGEVLVAPCPVMTCNLQPLRRVSFDERRNANPFFHLMESLWMLAGRNDGRWLDQFVGDFSSRFAEPDGRIHGAYGFRWRHHFDVEGGGERGLPDQLNKAVELLRANPYDRRVVISMWDPVADLGADVKDVPCNTHIYPRVVQLLDPDEPSVVSARALDLTVCCRSNDAVWGAHGANAVHFSVLQEYLAARIGVKVGVLYQLSNNYHVYTSELTKIWPMGEDEFYPRYSHVDLVSSPEEFDADLTVFFGPDWWINPTRYANVFFCKLAVPMRRSYALWREKKYREARDDIDRMYTCDWTLAAARWYDRRMAKMENKSGSE